MSFLERLRALGWFLMASAWFLFCDLVAFRSASGLSSGDWQEPLYRIFLLFLLVLGYWVLSRLGQRRLAPSAATGLALRPGWGREWRLGAALGWAGVIACVLPIALTGGLVVTVFTSAHQYFVVVLQLIALAAGTLAIEVAFRGYAFQRLNEAMGPWLGTLFMAVVYAIWRTHGSPATTAAALVSFLLGWVLALAALRTRALWVGWGFHFAWVASMGMLFGLPVSGSMSYSPIIAANSIGPAWITGDGQGPEGSAFAVLVTFLLLFAMARVTEDLKYKYGFPPIVPGGVPVDLDAAARAQHEAAEASPPAEPQLVQILPAQSVAPLPAPPLPEAPADSSPESHPAPERELPPGSLGSSEPADPLDATPSSREPHEPQS